MHVLSYRMDKFNLVKRFQKYHSLFKHMISYLTRILKMKDELPLAHLPETE